MKNIYKSWNLLDALIFFSENKIYQFCRFVKDSKAEADPEQIIEAAISHLKLENEELKDYRIPEKAVYKSGQYYCPKCGIQIEKELIERFHVGSCPECGKILKKYSRYKAMD